MKILFSTRFDEPTYPINSFLQDGAVAGCRHMGPSGLLSLLELHLGLAKPPENNALRVFRYRIALKKLTPGSFFEKSFQANELDVTDELLSWRDRLIRAGWDFKVDPNTPARLQQLAGVEKEFADTSGFSDRFRTMIEALKKRPKLPLEELIHFEPLELFPPELLELIQLLRQNSVTCSPYHPQEFASDESDLSSLRSFVLAKEHQVADQIEAKGDGSLRLILLPDRLQTAGFLSCLIGNSNPNNVVIISGNNEVQASLNLLDAKRPNPGISVTDPAPVGVSLLYLVPLFLWKPWQTQRLFDFFQCPVPLLPPLLSRLLAEAMTIRPGIDSESWTTALNNYRNSIEDDDRFNRVQERLNFLLDYPKFDPSGGAPVHAIRELFKFTGDRIRARMAHIDRDDQKEQMFPVVSSISNLLEILSLYGEDEKITDLELQRVIGKSISIQTYSIAARSAGSPAVISSPGNLAGFADTVIWHDFASDGSSGSTFDPLLKEEITWLESRGVLLESPDLKARRNSWFRKQFIRFVKKELICLIPENVAGESSHPHPFRSFIDARFSSVHKLITRISVPDSVNLSDKLSAQTTSLPQAPVPPPAAYWHVTRTVDLVIRDQAVSYSSLSTLVDSPFMWVLKYKAKIEDETILRLTDDAQFMGNISHHIFQHVLSREETDVTKLSQEELEALYIKAADCIISTEGMLLLEKGKEDRMAMLHQKVKKNFLTLVRHIRENSWKVEGCELHKKEHRGDYLLQGYVDLLLSRKKKGSVEYAIVDLKWRGESFYSGLMNENKDLQLALYSLLFNEEGSFSPTAYYIINSGRLFTRDHNAFKGGILVGTPEEWKQEYSSLIKRLYKTVAFRLNELKEGKIEMGEGCPIDELEIFSQDPELFLIPKGQDVKEPSRFNDYTTFTDTE